MATKRVAAIRELTTNPVAWAVRTRAWRNRMVWLVVIAAGLTAGHPQVASAHVSVDFSTEPPEGGTTNYGKEGEEHEFLHNELVEIVATPAPCYQFAGWEVTYGDVYIWDTGEADTWMQCPGGIWYTFHSVTAHFLKRIHSVNVCDPTNGTLSMAPGSGNLLGCGERYSITATPDACYRFKRWNATFPAGVADYTAATTDMWVVSDGGTLCAEFEKITYTVTVYAPTNGTVSPGPGNHTYDCGSVISITATPPEHYKFKQWNSSGGVTVADPTGASTTMTVTGDGTLRPVFEIITTGVPDVVGMMQEDAEEALTAAGYKVGTISWTQSTLPEGTVVSQDPAGGEVRPLESLVDLTVSQGSGAGPGPGPGPAIPALVGHWKLDETTGVTALDSSGNSHDGTLHGNPTWQPSGGQIGGALKLDGVDDYVDCGNDPAFNLTEQITLAVWVNASDMCNGQDNDWLSKGDHAYAIKHQRSNYIEFFVYGGGAWHGTNYSTDIASLNGEWHHIAGKFDGQELQFYLDGELKATLAYAGPIGTTTDAVMLGENSEAKGRFFNGMLDDARIYNGALSASEVAALVAGESGPRPTTLPSPVAHWTLDESTGTVAHDAAGSHDGVLKGNPLWQPSDGKIAGALKLDGVDDYVDCGNASVLNITARITLAAWIRTEDCGNGQYNPYISKGDRGYILQHKDNNGLEFCIFDGTWYWVWRSVTSSFNGEWHHVTGTYDGRQLALYVDGQAQVTADHVGSIASTTYPVNLGRTSDMPDRLYAGALDDVRIYDEALTAQQVAALLTPEPGGQPAGETGLVAWWKLDETTGATASDGSGNGHNGRLVGNPKWTPNAGGINGALRLDGVDDYVDCGNDPAFNLTEQVTLAVWVNANDMGNGQHNDWISKGDHTYAIKHQQNNYVEFFVYGGGTWHLTQYSTDLASLNGEWHHMAGTFDGHDLKFYLDGELKATAPYAGPIGSTADPVTMGENSEARGRFFKGMLDDARIYNRALSPAEITESMAP